MVISKAPNRTDPRMKIPGELIDLEMTNLVFEKLNASDDFEKFMENQAYAMLAAYAFKDLAKSRTSKMKTVNSNVPILIDLDESDFREYKYSSKELRFTEKKLNKALKLFTKKLDDTNLVSVLSLLQQDLFGYLPKEFDKLKISKSGFENMKSDNDNFLMGDLESDNKIQKVIGYKFGVGLKTDVPKGKTQKETKETETKYRNKNLLDKFDKGTPVIDLDRSSKLFESFLENITVDKKEIQINTEAYMKHVMGLYGYYDTKTDEWQVDISEAKTSKHSVSSEEGEKLELKIEGLINSDESSDINTEINQKESAKKYIRKLKRLGWFDADKAKEMLDRVNSRFEEATSQHRESAQIQEFNVGEQQDEEEERDEVTVVEPEIEEKMLKAINIIRKAYGQSRDIKRVDENSIEYVTLLGKIEIIDGKETGKLLETWGEGLSDWEGITFKFKNYKGEEVKYSSPRELWNNRLHSLQKDDIKRALLSDSDNGLKRNILASITPSNGKIEIGMTTIKYIMPNWKDDDSGYDKFLLNLRKHLTISEDYDEVYLPELLKVGYILVRYHALKTQMKLDVEGLLNAYGSDDSTFRNDIVKIMSAILEDKQTLERGESFSEDETQTDEEGRPQFYETDEEGKPDETKPIEHQFGESKDTPQSVESWFNRIKKPRPSKARGRQLTKPVETDEPSFQRVPTLTQDWNKFTQKYGTSLDEIGELHDDLTKLWKAIDEGWKVGEVEIGETGTKVNLGNAKLFYNPKGKLPMTFKIHELYDDMSKHKVTFDRLVGWVGKRDDAILIHLLEEDELNEALYKYAGIDEEDISIDQPEMNLMWLGQHKDKQSDKLSPRKALNTKHTVFSSKKGWRSKSSMHDKEKAEEVTALKRIQYNYAQMKQGLGA
jgi:hypothetical protein